MSTRRLARVFFTIVAAAHAALWTWLLTWEGGIRLADLPAMFPSLLLGTAALAGLYIKGWVE